MSISSNVSDQDLINLRELAKQQKNQRALKFKKQNFKTNSRYKISRKCITNNKEKRWSERNYPTIRDVNKKSQPETPQLAIENSPNHQPI